MRRHLPDQIGRAEGESGDFLLLVLESNGLQLHIDARAANHILRGP